MKSESLVQETLEGLKGHATMFIIAHRLSTLNTCDRIMVLSKGELQGFDTAAELRRSNPFFAKRRPALAVGEPKAQKSSRSPIGQGPVVEGGHARRASASVAR